MSNVLTMPVRAAGLPTLPRSVPARVIPLEARPAPTDMESVLAWYYSLPPIVAAMWWWDAAYLLGGGPFWSEMLLNWPVPRLVDA